MAKKTNLNDYKCIFPAMDYTDKMVPLETQAVSPLMLGLVRERADWVLAGCGLSSLADLENTIGGFIWGFRDTGCQDMDVLQEVFHRIQIWGGEHGRYIYVQGAPFDWAEIGPAYRKLALASMDEDRDYADLARKSRSFNAVMQDQGRRLGMSFITKHMHFWSAATRGGDALPIYDRIMASGLRLRPVWEHLELYWVSMAAKADELGIPVSVLERQLFNRLRGIHPEKRREGNDPPGTPLL